MTREASVNYRTSAAKTLVTAGNGAITARDLRSGRTLWRAALPRAIGHVGSIAEALTRVVIVGEVVLVFGVETVAQKGLLAFPKASHVLVALALANGSMLWRAVLYEAAHAHPPGTMLVDDGVVVVSTAYATAAYEVAGGRLLWAEKVPPLEGMVEGSSPACGVALAVDGTDAQADGYG